MHEKTNSVYKNFWIFISFIAAVLILSLFIYLNKLQSNLISDMRVDVAEKADMERDALAEKLHDDTQTIKALAGLMSRYYNITDIDTFLEVLDEENNRNDFVQMGMVMLDGTAYFHDRSIVKDFLSKENLDEIEAGKTITVGGIKDRYTEDYIIVIAAPVYAYGKIQAAVFATHPANYYSKILENPKFGGFGYSYIVNKEGDIVVNTPLLENSRTENFLEYAKKVKFDKPTTYQTVLDDFKEYKEGFATFTRHKKHRFMAFMPIGVNEWYLIFVVPTAPFMHKVNDIMIMSVMLCFEIFLLFTLLMLHIKKTEQKSKEAFFLNAFIDPLTESGNLNKFKMDLSKILQENPDTLFALAALDIDKFKVINELYGYRQGDMVLIHISNVLKENLGPKEPFARMSSDKFIFALTYEQQEDLKQRITKISEEIKNCYASTDLNYEIIANCGVFLIERGLPFYLMLDRAHLACAEARRNKPSHFAFYRDNSRKQILTEKSIENSMREALLENQFKLYFQPKVNLQTLKMEGAEILVRWKHPTKGIIMPDVFIPIFERNGFIINLDMYMLDNAAKELRKCLDKGIKPVSLAVNFSRLHINNPKFCEEFKQTADFYQIPNNLIEAEITETTILDNLDKIKTVIEQFHKDGYLIAIDDFGAGYSSLNVLKNLHFDTLKLDKEFLNTYGDDKRAKDIIAGTVKMLKALKVKIVAEGVETKEQALFLKQIGCDNGQGYLFSKPVPIENFAEMLKNNDFSAVMSGKKPFHIKEQKQEEIQTLQEQQEQLKQAQDKPKEEPQPLELAPQVVLPEPLELAKKQNTAAAHEQTETQKQDFSAQQTQDTQVQKQENPAQTQDNIPQQKTPDKETQTDELPNQQGNNSNIQKENNSDTQNNKKEFYKKFKHKHYFKRRKR